MTIKPDSPWLNHGSIVRTLRDYKRAPAGSIGVVVAVNRFYATIQSGRSRLQVSREDLVCDTPKTNEEIRSTTFALIGILETVRKRTALKEHSS